MDFLSFLAYVVGSLTDPIVAGGILIIGLLSKKKKTAFGLGLVWGVVFMYLSLAAQKQLQSIVELTNYLLPFVYALLSSFITWTKLLFEVKNMPEKKFPPITEHYETNLKVTLNSNSVISYALGENGPFDIDELQEEMHNKFHKNQWAGDKEIVPAITTNILKQIIRASGGSKAQILIDNMTNKIFTDFSRGYVLGYIDEYVFNTPNKSDQKVLNFRKNIFNHVYGEHSEQQLETLYKSIESKNSELTSGYTLGKADAKKVIGGKGDPKNLEDFLIEDIKNNNVLNIEASLKSSNEPTIQIEPKNDVSLPTNFFSDDEFIKILREEDELGVVLRVHIDFEQFFNKIIGYFIPNEEKLDEVKLSYFQKIRLAVLCGLKKEHINCYQKFGEIRNQFAHKPKTKLTDEMVNGWYHSLSASSKECVQQAFNSTNTKVPAESRLSAFDKLDHKNRFILIAVALRSLLKVAIQELENMEVK